MRFSFEIKLNYYTIQKTCEFIKKNDDESFGYFYYVKKNIENRIEFCFVDNKIKNMKFYCLFFSHNQKALDYKNKIGNIYRVKKFN